MLKHRLAALPRTALDLPLTLASPTLADEAFIPAPDPFLVDSRDA